VDGISDVAECGRGLLVVRVYASFFMYRIEYGWAGLCRGVGRGYTGVALKGEGYTNIKFGPPHPPPPILQSVLGHSAIMLTVSTNNT
jgi:hypothetical protein